MAPLMENISVYASQQLDALASKKMLGGIKLIVKNTFFDVEEDVPETPSMLGLQRARTEPAPLIEIDREVEQDQQVPTPGLHDASRDGACIAFPTDHLSGHTTPEYFESYPEFFPMANACLDLQTACSMAEAPMTEQLFLGVPDDQGTMLGVHSPPDVGEWPLMGGQYPVTAGYASSEFDMQLYSGPELPMTGSEVAPQLSNVPSAVPTEAFMPEEWEVLEQGSQPFQPQSLRVLRSRFTGATRILWTVDGRKLRSNDRLTVSPLFELCDGHVNAPPLPFKMIINPKIASDAKGGASFRKANGMSIIQLKCEAPREDRESYPITFYMAAGNGREENPRQHPRRGPVTCNFAQSGVCGLPKECEIWDLLAVVDEHSKTFVVCLDAMPPML